MGFCVGYVSRYLAYADEGRGVHTQTALPDVCRVGTQSFHSTNLILQLKK